MVSMDFKTIIIIIIMVAVKSVYSFNAFNSFVRCVMYYNYVNIERIILTYKLRTWYIKQSRCHVFLDEEEILVDRLGIHN